MNKCLILVLTPVLLCLFACEEELDPYNDLLPLVAGSSFNYDSDSDDDAWFINVEDGAGFEGAPSWDYTMMVRDGLDNETPYMVHDLYAGEEGWTEVDPAETTPNLFLKLPAAKSDTWEQMIVLSTTTTTYDFVYDTREDITVPAGTFEAAWLKLEVKLLATSNDSWETTTRDWFAPGVGLVKRVITSSAGEDTTLTLTDYEFPEE